MCTSAKHSLRVKEHERNTFVEVTFLNVAELIAILRLIL